MTDVRRIAYDALCRTEDGTYTGNVTKDVLDKYSYLDREDKAFLKRLIEGTVERKITLDYVLDMFSKVPSSKMKKGVRVILRMGTYQLLYMDGVSDYAAVNETVGLIKKTGLRNLSGFVNGVLRSVSKNIANINWPDEADDPAYYMSVMYSCPYWITQKLLAEQGYDAAKTLLELSVSVRPVTARINTSKTSAEDVLAMSKLTASDVYDKAVVLNDPDDIASMKAFSEGLICIQDISSMLVCEVAGIKNDDTVLDLCASPGGKSMHAADIAVNGEVISCDVSEQKIERIEENIQRCGFTNVKTRVMDATVYDESLEGLADIVIADVPCSGLGVMGRKNDIKYNITPQSVEELISLQKSILKNAVAYVKPGGTLMFSTCTCSDGENMGNVRFLTGECALTPEGFYDELPEAFKCETARDGYMQLVGAGKLTDGFFIGKFRK